MIFIQYLYLHFKAEIITAIHSKKHAETEFLAYFCFALTIINIPEIIFPHEQIGFYQNQFFKISGHRQ